MPASDTIGPKVLSTVPASNKNDVDIFDSITIQFDESIQTVNESNIRIFAYDTLDSNTAKLVTTQKIPYIEIGFNDKNNTLSFNLDTKIATTASQTNFKVETRYQIQITGVMDKTGNKMSDDFVWQFTTVTAPRGAIQPPDGASRVSRETDITISFSEAMNVDANSVNSLAANFKLLDKGKIGSPVIAGSEVATVNLSYDDNLNQAIFSVKPELLQENRYQFILAANVTDEEGIPLAAAIVSNFTTGVATSAVPNPQFTGMTAGDTSVTLNWNESIEFTYKLEQKSPATANDASYTKVVYSILPHTIPDLINGTSYRFRLTATNGNGTSKNVVTTLTPQVQVPKVPVLSLSYDVKQLLFSWQKPVNSTVDYYVLKQDLDGAPLVYSVVPGASRLTALSFSIDQISVHRFNWAGASFILQACNNTLGCTNSVGVSTVGGRVNALGKYNAGATGVELSEDGLTLAVAANNFISLYTYDVLTKKWILQELITGIASGFGHAISLSNNGNTLISYSRISNTIAIFKRSNSTWSEIQVQIQRPWIRFDLTKVSISGDASTIAFTGSRSVKIYIFNGSQYVPFSQTEPSVKLTNPVSNDYFGNSLQLNKTGKTILVGAWGDNDSVLKTQSGAVYIFTRNDLLKSWNTPIKIKPNVISSGDNFGKSLAISDDGLTIAVGAPGDDTTINDSGAVYIFKSNGTSWPQIKKIKNLQPQLLANFGNSVELNQLGTILAVSAENDNRIAKGSGASYLFEGTNWNQSVYLHMGLVGNFIFNKKFGKFLAISNDASVFANSTNFADGITTESQYGETLLY